VGFDLKRVVRRGTEGGAQGCLSVVFIGFPLEKTVGLRPHNSHRIIE